MNLSDFNFPKVTRADIAFSSFNTIPELLDEAKKRESIKGKRKFSELFFKGGELDLQDDVIGTWKEKALLYAKALMTSFAPKHQDKEAVCAMIFEETLKL